MARPRIYSLELFVRFCLLLSLSALGILLLITACGQDTPIVVDNVTHASWPDSITGTPFANGVTPDLLRGIATPTAASVDPQTTPLPNATESPLPTDLNAALPECAPVIATPRGLPTNFAPNFPLPPGLRLFKSAQLNNNPNALQIVGYVPLNLQDSIRFLLERLPQSGYTLGRGDSEPGEAEATFSGNQWRGGFLITTVNGCPTVTEWGIVVIKQ